MIAEVLALRSAPMSFGERILFAAVLAAVGGSISAAAGYLLITARNFPGRLGRGLTPWDDIRLARAPAIYFRSMGALLGSIGATVLWVAVGMGLYSSSPSYEYQIWVAGLIIGTLAAFVSLGLFVVLSIRYKMTRWSKP